MRIGRLAARSSTMPGSACGLGDAAVRGGAARHVVGVRRVVVLPRGHATLGLDAPAAQPALGAAARTTHTPAPPPLVPPERAEPVTPRHLGPAPRAPPPHHQTA